MNIAVVDDEEAIREQIGGFIKKRNPDFDISGFATGEGLLAAGKDFDIIFLDIQMEGICGIEAARSLRQSGVDAVVIFITGILYILIGLAILFGFYKMFIDDEKGVGYISFIFAVLVFLVTLIPNDKEEKIDESQGVVVNIENDEEGQAESKEDRNEAENENENREDDKNNQENADRQQDVSQSETEITAQEQDKMIYLEKLDYFNSSNSSGNAFRYYESAKDNLGFSYGNGIGGVNQGENWQEYKLSGKYKEIQGRVILNYDYRSQTNDDVLIKIYGDDMLLYMSPAMAAGQEPVDFNINISDVDVLKVSIVGENMVRLVDCVLYDSLGNQNKEYQTNETGGDKVYLQNIDYIASSNTSGNGFRYYDTVTDNLGLTYGNGLGGVGQGENWQDYKLNGKYKEFQARVVLNYDYRSQVSDDVLVKIYGDDMLLYMSPIMSAGQEPVDIKLNITGVDILRVSIVGENMVRLVDGILYASDGNESKEYQYSGIDKDIISLHLLDYISSSNTSGAAFSYYSSVKDNMNNVYADGIGGNSAYLNWQEYKVYGNYNSIQGKIILNYDYKEQESGETYVNIYGDSNLLYTSPLITAGQEPVEFNVNIEGIDKLRISIEGRNMIRIVECYLKKVG